MKVLRAANDNRAAEVSRTRHVWEGRIGRELGDDDARQIARNVTGFFKILMEWAEAEKRTGANDNADPNAFRDGEVGRER
jgi:hypothetical protein